MGFLDTIFISAACLAVTSPVECFELPFNVDAPKMPAISQPTFQGESSDVIITATAALVWDVESGQVLYEKAAQERRPIASLIKLLSTAVIADQLPMDGVAKISASAAKAGRQGANVKLPVGHNVQVEQLLAASLIASANDAVVTLAEAMSGTEELFVQEANAYAKKHGLSDTHAVNATGLPQAGQFSTAQDVRRLLQMAYDNPQLSPYLAKAAGQLTTQEGYSVKYESTNDLLQTYVPILAAKTGYTVEAGQNLAIITLGPAGQKIGAVILGSNDRFQDMKVLVEWIWRHYLWI